LEEKQKNSGEDDETDNDEEENILDKLLRRRVSPERQDLIENVESSGEETEGNEIDDEVETIPQGKQDPLVTTTAFELAKPRRSASRLDTETHRR
jgi:hypothetical protein